MRVLVCGGRDFDNYNFIDVELNKIKESIGAIIHGAARGADSLAGAWANINNIKEIKFPAKWEKYGRKAGFIRNKQMLEEGQPDLVVAFPGGRGTKMMVDLARKAGVEVIDYNDG